MPRFETDREFGLAGSASSEQANRPYSARLDTTEDGARHSPGRRPASDSGSEQTPVSGSPEAPALPPLGAAMGGPALTPPVSQIDEYHITKALGRGGMGQVFLGHDTLLDRPVAVKFLVTRSPTERLRKRFLIEARALARVHHPNIVAIYRVGIFSGLPYLVSELVAGQSLERVPKPLPWPEVLRIGIDVARGLTAVHAHGVLHRDLKPANVATEKDCTANDPRRCGYYRRVPGNASGLHF